MGYPRKIAAPERSQQGKQENSRGILPVRLTSSGTDAGGVQPTLLITQSQTTGGGGGRLEAAPS